MVPRFGLWDEEWLCRVCCGGDSAMLLSSEEDDDDEDVEDESESELSPSLRSVFNFGFLSSVADCLMFPRCSSC